MPGSFDSFDASVYSPSFMNKTRQVSSRLAKREQNKIAKQTAVIVLAAIVLLVVFVFVVVPALIRLAGTFLDTGSFSEPEDTIPPQVPIISAPPTATPSAQIALNGYGEAKSEMVLINNGQEVTRFETGDDGKFSVDIDLEEGANDLSIYSIDEAGNESDLSRSYNVIFDATNPELEFDGLEDGQEFQLKANQNITIKGTTEENAKVYVNDRLLFTKSDGTFSGSYLLDEGENTLKFRVIDQAGNVTERELKVIFKY